MKRCLPLVLCALLSAAPLATISRAVPGVPGPAPKEAWLIPVNGNWELQGGLPLNLMKISLQGLANTDVPRVYIDYPPDWKFHGFLPVLDYYKTAYGIQFTRLDTPDAILDALGKFAKGYVVWDQDVRPSINVALTYAGIHRAVLVDAGLIPLMKRHGLKQLEDFRGRFTGKSDVQIYQWAYEHYWDQCSRDYLIWMGGVAGKRMEPAVADMAIASRAFVTDLSADPREMAEYELQKKILSQMNPLSWVIGWHSYAKDTEGQWVTLTSTYGLKVMGLNTFPNLTFMSQIGFTPGFKLTNNNHVTRDEKLVPEDKVYIALVQSDSLGLGAWDDPLRGQIYYNWSVGVDGAQWFPAVLEMYAREKTPKDYFVGWQSGYMYPAAIPPSKFPTLLRDMADRMARLDEHVVEIMDHTDRGVPIGYFDLTKGTVDAYYANVPDAIGFINGYAAAHTFDLRNGQAFMSYDYYVAPKRSVEDVAADMNELMRLNPRRPYYMLVHVRETNSIKRMMAILDRLKESPEVVPLDTFLKLAAGNKTYKTRYKTVRPSAP